MLLEDVLSRSSMVVILKLHTVCTNNMLNTISQVCRNLISIDISFSKHVTDDGIEKICDHEKSFLPSKLRQILLDGTSVTSKSVHCLLENFPQLINIDSSLMEKFLLSMQSLFQNSNQRGMYVLKKYNLASKILICCEALKETLKVYYR